MQQSYAWRGHTFVVDANLIDKTTVVLAAPSPTGAPTWTLTLARDVVGAGLKASVDGVLRDLVVGLSGFRLLSRNDNATLAGRPAVLTSHTALTPEGAQIQQWQAFSVDDDGLVIVTASALNGHETVAKMAFDQLLASWAPLSSH
jgi:hypothetical protein